MKSFFIPIIALAYCLLSCSNSISMPEGKNYQITLHLDSVLCANEQWVYLHSYNEDDHLIDDSAKIERGQREVVLYGYREQEHFVNILFSKKGPAEFRVIVNPGDCIEADIEESDGDAGLLKEVKGSPSTNEYSLHCKTGVAINQDKRDLASRLTIPTLTDAEKDHLVSRIDSLGKVIDNMELNLVRTSKSPTIVEMKLAGLRNKVDKDSFNVLYQSALKRFPNYDILKYLMDENRVIPPQSAQSLKDSPRIDDLIQKKLAITYASSKKVMPSGNTSMSIDSLSLCTIDGNKLSVSQIEGDYILVDFWASWCIPCIEGLSYVREAKKMYGDRLVVCAVSLDKNHAIWRKKIATMGMIKFINLIATNADGVMDGQIRDLGITSIPVNYLLDRNHKIVAKNISNKEFMSTLDKFLKK